VIDKLPFDSYAKTIQERLTDTIFVGHNANFDYSFLKYEMKRSGFDFKHPKLCTVMLGRKLLPQLSNAHQDAISNYYNIKITQRHRALQDAEATAIVLNKFIEMAVTTYGAKNYYDLERLQKIKVNRNLARGEYDSYMLDL
jgi:DNA polymerase III subunit epsilon